MTVAQDNANRSKETILSSLQILLRILILGLTLLVN